MSYKVEFEENEPVRAIRVDNPRRLKTRIEYGNIERTEIKALYLEASSEADALLQAKSVLKTILK